MSVASTNGNGAIYVGIDDTDNLDSPGTNQIARRIVAALSDDWQCRLIVRHQLLQDSRVPMTSHNSSATLLFEAGPRRQAEELRERVRGLLVEFSAAGSDPGLCVTSSVPEGIASFGARCQRKLVSRDEAVALADRYGLMLEGLGGTNDGMIGALAAVGLTSTGDDGRIVNIGRWPDDLAETQPVAAIRERGVDVRDYVDGSSIETGDVDVGKRLRPNYRGGRIVLFVERQEDSPVWRALRLL